MTEKELVVDREKLSKFCDLVRTMNEQELALGLQFLNGFIAGVLATANRDEDI